MASAKLSGSEQIDDLWCMYQQSVHSEFVETDEAIPAFHMLIMLSCVSNPKRSYP